MRMINLLSSDKRKVFVCFGDGQVREIYKYHIDSQTKSILIKFKRGQPKEILVNENAVFGLNSNYRMNMSKFTAICPCYDSFGNPIPIEDTVIGNFVRKIQWLEDNLKRKNDFIKALQYDLYKKNIPTNELVDDIIKRIEAVNIAHQPLRARYIKTPYSYGGSEPIPSEIIEDQMRGEE